MMGSIDEFIVEGIHTTLPLQRDLLDSPEFRSVTHWTRFVDEWVAKPESD